MSIFRREVQSPPAKPAAPPRPVVSPSAAKPSSPGHDATIIANGTKVVGEISGQARLVIDGVVDGSIQLQSEVVIGGQGRVEGTVLAESVQVGGKVHGNIRGVKKVEVLTSGSLEGDVTSPRVVIADGAFFKGKVEMTEVGPIPRPGAGNDKTPPTEAGKSTVSSSTAVSAGKSSAGTAAAGSPSDNAGKPGSDPAKGGPGMGSHKNPSHKNRGGR